VSQENGPPLEQDKVSASNGKVLIRGVFVTLQFRHPSSKERSRRQLFGRKKTTAHGLEGVLRQAEKGGAGTMHGKRGGRIVN